MPRLPIICGSRGALQAHRASEHGYFWPARRLHIASFCPACLTDFGTRPRVLHHLRLRQGATCLRTTLEQWAPIHEVEWRVLDRADARAITILKAKGRKETWAERPAFSPSFMNSILF